MQSIYDEIEHGFVHIVPIGRFLTRNKPRRDGSANKGDSLGDMHLGDMHKKGFSGGITRKHLFD